MSRRRVIVTDTRRGPATPSHQRSPRTPPQHPCCTRHTRATTFQRLQVTASNVLDIKSPGNPQMTTEGQTSVWTNSEAESTSPCSSRHHPYPLEGLAGLSARGVDSPTRGSRLADCDYDATTPISPLGASIYGDSEDQLHSRRCHHPAVRACANTSPNAPSPSPPRTPPRPRLDALISLVTSWHAGGPWMGAHLGEEFLRRGVASFVLPPPRWHAPEYAGLSRVSAYADAAIDREEDLRRAAPISTAETDNERWHDVRTSSVWSLWLVNTRLPGGTRV
ncbi:hypothetical protein BKA93DRAFT_752461 [Sparassis latifolia]